MGPRWSVLPEHPLPDPNANPQRKRAAACFAVKRRAPKFACAASCPGSKSVAAPASATSAAAPMATKRRSGPRVGASEAAAMATAGCGL